MKVVMYCQTGTVIINPDPWGEPSYRPDPRDPIGPDGYSYMRGTPIPPRAPDALSATPGSARRTNRPT